MIAASVIGWDVGGAHVKAARISAEHGTVDDVVQLPCALWQGIGRLDLPVAQIIERFGAANRHALTMTGEMADSFENRALGVSSIAQRMANLIGDADLMLYAGRMGFVRLASIHAQELCSHIASANWHATASCLAARCDAALLIDVGSTTTDIVAVTRGEVHSHGHTDAQRLACNELVYTGVVRTPVMALAACVAFRGESAPLMAELFATSADVHRLTGELPAHADQQPSADGKEKTTLASARRLARMIGRDVEDATLDDWRELARRLSEAQTRQIEEAAARVLARVALAADAPIVGAGVGRFVARRVASALSRAYREFHLMVAAPEAASEHAPAVAVALLKKNANES